MRFDTGWRPDPPPCSIPAPSSVTPATSRDSMTASSWSVSDTMLRTLTDGPNMNSSSRFALPAKLPPGLGRVRDYWESLKRGEASMPFWDDVKLSSLPDLSDRLLLVDAFENPPRFRLNSVGAQIR